VPDESPAPRLAAGSGTILVVDDEPAVRSVVAEALTESGYRVVVAEDGNAALAVAAAHEGPIDLILTDLVMPGVGGAEAAERLATVMPGVRCLYMSGYSEDVMAMNAIRDGASFLQKPFSLTALTEAVRHALNGAGATRNGR
jgi:two-component system cell cycle sensor histidine kinase/response regulator CckA